MKAPLKLTSAVLAVLGLGSVLLQQRSLSNFRTENQRLTTASEEAERLKSENAAISRIRAQNQELQTVRAETRDLHKLRNEVRQLREQTKGLPSVRTENERLRGSTSRSAMRNAPPAGPPQTFTLEDLRFAGYATPEATLQTMFWAMKQGDIDAVQKCLSDEARKEMGEESPEDVRRGMEAMAKQFKGLRIAARKVISPNEMQLGVQMSNEGNDTPDEQSIPFKLVGGEWRLGSMK
jgi:myosin heavy subunit